MSRAKEKVVALLGSSSGVNMQTGGAVTLYTTPVGKTTRIMHAVIRDISATLAGGTQYTITGLVTNADLSGVTGGSGTAFVVLRPVTNLTGQTEIAASTAVQFTPTTGSTGAATATIDIFGYET